MDGDEVFYPNRKKQIYLLVILLVLTLGSLLSWHAASTHPPVAPATKGSNVFLSLFPAILFLVFAMISLMGLILKLPRLSFGAEGVKYQTVLSHKWADWDSLAPFKLQKTHVGQFNRKVLSARSTIQGINVSDNLIKKPHLLIGNSFNVPLDRIIETLNGSRARSLAGQPEADPGQLLHKQSAPDLTVAWNDTDARPWVTYGILAFLTIVYLIELLGSLDGPHKGTPSVVTLIALGGLNKGIIESTGQFYRFFTAPLLHGSFSHLLGNGFALFFAGVMLEKMVGWRWFLALYVLGGLGGALMSYTLNDPATTSVGASGAIMALFAALFTSSFRMEKDSQRTHIQLQSLRVIVPSLLPLASSHGVHVDLSAHLGGAVVGCMASFGLIRIWAKNQADPPFEKTAQGIGIAGLLAIILSVIMVAVHYPAYAAASVGLIPAAELPRNEKAMSAQSADLVAHYPHDPRAHLFRAKAYLAEKNYEAAQAELETGLQDTAGFETIYGSKMTDLMRLSLSGFLARQGNMPRAREIAAPLCHDMAADPASLKLYQGLIRTHLCDP